MSFDTEIHNLNTLIKNFLAIPESQELSQYKNANSALSRLSGTLKDILELDETKIVDAVTDPILENILDQIYLLLKKIKVTATDLKIENCPNTHRQLDAEMKFIRPYENISAKLKRLTTQFQKQYGLSKQTTDYQYVLGNLTVVFPRIKQLIYKNATVNKELEAIIDAIVKELNALGVPTTNESIMNSGWINNSTTNPLIVWAANSTPVQILQLARVRKITTLISKYTVYYPRVKSMLHGHDNPHARTTLIRYEQIRRNLAATNRASVSRQLGLIQNKNQNSLRQLRQFIDNNIPAILQNANIQNTNIQSITAILDKNDMSAYLRGGQDVVAQTVEEVFKNPSIDLKKLVKAQIQLYKKNPTKACQCPCGATTGLQSKGDTCSSCNQQVVEKDSSFVDTLKTTIQNTKTQLQGAFQYYTATLNFLKSNRVNLVPIYKAVYEQVNKKNNQILLDFRKVELRLIATAVSEELKYNTKKD